MKNFKLPLSLAALFLAGQFAAASDLAILQIRFGKEKEPRTVTIELHEAEAPATVENFKRLARRGFYKRQKFHRAIPGFLVQTGDPASRGRSKLGVGTGGPGYSLPAEINRPVKSGSVAMARLPDAINPARLSSGSQFFIALTDMPDLSGNHTVFGTVIDGMDVLEEIASANTDSNDYPIEHFTIRSIAIQPAASE